MDRKAIFHLTKPIHLALPWKLCAALLLLGTSLLCGCSYSHGQAITSKEAGEKNASNEASKASVAPEAEKAVESEKKAELFDGVNHISMFDGETLGSWQVADMYHNGNVYVKDGCMILEKSDYMTGVKWTGPLIDMNYEISYEAMRVEGDDFFAALTFPVGKRSCTLILSGWHNTVNGLSSIDNKDASLNETTLRFGLENNRWYKVDLRVTSDRIQARLNGEWIVDVDTTGKNIDIRIECIPCEPLGFATYMTTGAIRNIRMSKLLVQ